MKERLFTLAAGTSLLLCATTVALWVRSYWVFDLLHRQDNAWRTIGSARGRIELVFTYPAGWQYSWGPGVWRYRQHPVTQVGLLDAPAPSYARRDWRGLGFAYSDVGRNPSPHFGDNVEAYRQLVVPHWFIAAVTVVLPLAWATRKALGSRRSRVGRCATCGYDLRATPDRCPECGAKPAELTSV